MASNFEAEKLFYSVRETAHKSGISEGFIRQQIRNGLVPGLYSGNKYLIHYSDYMETLRKEWSNHD